jgi:sarcosine oxidase subunit gamma
VHGAGLFDLFERLTALDVHALAEGGAQRTVIGHVAAFLICEAPGARYTLLTPRSSAASAWHALTTAAETVSQTGRM